MRSKETEWWDKKDGVDPGTTRQDKPAEAKRREAEAEPANAQGSLQVTNREQGT